MDRPSPVPWPGCLVVKNGVKIWPVSAGGMPGPVSVTRTKARSPSRPVSTRIRLGALGGRSERACTALVSRFRRTCWISYRSPRTTARSPLTRSSAMPRNLSSAWMSSVVRWATSSRSTAACSGVPFRAKVSRFATIRPCPVRLLVNDLQVLSRRLGQPLLLQQQFREPGDRGEGIVQLVRDARHQLSDRGHLLVLDELRLQCPLVGHVLHHHHHRCRAFVRRERRRGEPEGPVEPGGREHRRQVRLPEPGPGDHLFRGIGLGEQGGHKGAPHQRGERDPGEQGQGAVGARDAPGAVDQRDALRQGVERRLPLLLALAQQAEEAAVGQHHRRLHGHGRDEPEVLGREGPVTPGRHRHGAERHAVGPERCHGGP